MTPLKNKLLVFSVGVVTGIVGAGFWLLGMYLFDKDIDINNIV